MRGTLLLGLVMGTSCLGLVGCGDDGAVPSGPVSFIDLRAEEVTARRAVIRFDTSVPTSCEAEYGLASDDLPLRAEDPDMAEGELAIDHEVPLEDLMPETTYFWRARAVDADGEVTFSEVQSFTTGTLPAADDQGMVNVAHLDMGTTVADLSSNWRGVGHDDTWGIHNALDGQMATEWSSDFDGDDTWVELDLGAERSVDQFAYRSRKMADGTSIALEVRLVLPDGTVLGPFDTPDPDVRYSFPLDPPVTMERVRFDVVRSTGGNVGAKEIELLSAAADPR